MEKQALVGILMGSDSDWPIMRACAETLKKFDIAYEANVLSAHRTPDQALEYAATAQSRGLKVLIGAAGAAARHRPAATARVRPAWGRGGGGCSCRPPAEGDHARRQLKQIAQRRQGFLQIDFAAGFQGGHGWVSL